MKVKRFILVGALIVFGTFRAAAQGYPVIDITNILASIENGYTMVQQLQAMYNNIQNAYQQLQQQIKSFESFDFSQLDARDPLGSWRSIMTYADRMMTYEENIESILNNRNLKIGKDSYSLTDVFTSNPIDTAKGMAQEGVGFVAVDPFEKKLTPEEKAAFHSKYGMSYGHYMRYNTIGEALQKKAAESIAYTQGMQENINEDRERLDKIVEQDADADSIIKQQQKTNSILAVQAQDTKTQANLLAKIGEMMGAAAAQNQEERKARQEERNINDLDMAEGLVNMINAMPSDSSFK
jgi:conjugal transfer/entry exclusion protein